MSVQEIPIQVLDPHTGKSRQNSLPVHVGFEHGREWQFFLAPIEDMCKLVAFCATNAESHQRSFGIPRSMFSRLAANPYGAPVLIEAPLRSIGHHDIALVMFRRMGGRAYPYRATTLREWIAASNGERSVYPTMDPGIPGQMPAPGAI